MELCYVDESGTPDIPGNTSHYILAGISIPIREWKRCESQIIKVKNKYGLSGKEIHTGWLLRPYLEQARIKDFEKLSRSERDVEVAKRRHAELLKLQKNPRKSKLYHRSKKNFAKTDSYKHLTFDERKQFVVDVAKLISRWDFARLFAECIDKLHFDPRSRRKIDEQAFEQIVSRYEHYLSIYSKTSDEWKYGLIIHDNNQTVSRRHTDLMKGYHQVGTFWTKVRHIIETPLFVDSQLTSMVQIADLCAYALRRYLENEEDYLFKHIYKVADTKNNKVVGIRHFTDDSCNCLICQGHR